MAVSVTPGNVLYFRRHGRHFPTHIALPDDVNELKRLLFAQQQQLIARTTRSRSRNATRVIDRNTQKPRSATLTQQRDAFHLDKLRLEVRLAKALKQAYGPWADRLSDPGQLAAGLRRASSTRSVD